MKRAAVLLFLFALVMLPVAAGAEVSGACTITLNGSDANGLSTPQTALEVSEDDTVAIEASTDAGRFTGHTVYLEFAGIKWKVDEGTDDGKSWTGTVNVADYAKYGVGLYKASGESSGVPCSGWAFINVSGNPLGTVAGASAAGATVIGGALMAGSAAGAARRGRRFADRTLPALQFSQVYGTSQPPRYEPTPDSGPAYEDKIDEWQERHPELTRDQVKQAYGDAKRDVRKLGCLGAVLPAAIQTTALMVSGMGAPGAGGVAIPTPKVPPLVSVSGVIGAFFAGLGTLVLAQQYGIVYPTALVTVTWLLAWVVVDVVITTVARRSAVKKAVARASAAQRPAVPEEPA